MSIKTLVIAAAMAAGTLGFADRADAQWRRGMVYRYPTDSYSPGVVYSSYSYPAYYSDGTVVTAGYSTPYYSSYYPSTYYPSSSYYTTPGYYYPGGYVNMSG